VVEVALVWGGELSTQTNLPQLGDIVQALIHSYLFFVVSFQFFLDFFRMTKIKLCTTIKSKPKANLMSSSLATTPICWTSFKVVRQGKKSSSGMMCD